MQVEDVTENLEDLELTKTNLDEASNMKHGDKIMAQKLWRECNEKTIENVVEIALKCRLLTGKWMIFPSNKNTVVDAYWRKIAVGIFNKRFGDKVTTAKVSPHNEDAWSHVICIYTDNFCDQDQVLQLEDMLRRAGIFCPLFFKPDIFSHLGN